MASHYRRERIEDYFHKLRVRRAVLKNQMDQEEFKDMKHYITGEIKALDTVLAELKQEFDIRDPDDD